MKIIHQNGYSKEELLQFKPVVQKNVLDSAQALVMAMRKLGVDPEDPANRTHADRILEYKMDPEGVTNPDIFLAVEALWHDPIIPVVMDRSSEFYLMDSATYFFANIRRIGAPDYVPDESDVLRARTKTTGISETRFNMGQLNIHMFDVGGQRSERKKWIHCESLRLTRLTVGFEAVTSIIFCVALSEYDQVLLEENGQNRMQESLVLFESVINSRWFLRTSVILFLNKIDVFKQKLPKVPLVNYFPEYTGGADINKAAKYILWRFTQTNRARLSVYPHLTQATDTSNVSIVEFQLMPDSPRLCSSQGDYSAKCPPRLGHLIMSSPTVCSVLRPTHTSSRSLRVNRQMYTYTETRVIYILGISSPGAAKPAAIASFHASRNSSAVRPSLNSTISTGIMLAPNVGAPRFAAGCERLSMTRKTGSLGRGSESLGAFLASSRISLSSSYVKRRESVLWRYGPKSVTVTLSWT